MKTAIAAAHTRMASSPHTRRFYWIRIGRSSRLANRACASWKDYQPDFYHQESIASICEFVYGWWRGRTFSVKLSGVDV